VSCQVLPAADYGEVLHLVEAGQADAGIVARLYGDQHGAKYDVDRTPILCCPVELRFAAPKGRSADLLAALDRHLAALKADPGSLYFRSLDRWLGGPRSAGLPDWVPRALALGGAAVVLLAGGTLYFRWQMRARTRHLQAEIARREQVEEGLRRARHEWEEIFQAIGHHNALKFVAPGTRPQVRLWAEERDEGVRLWVEDNGIGIAPEHHERIFHIFERLHGWDAFPGTGVGLAIVRHGVERMGGRAGVESEVGKGSRFWVELKKAEATGPSP
jgi:C4-dicarboxylate-specific signal transduction histidine kinase